MNTPLHVIRLRLAVSHGLNAIRTDRKKDHHSRSMALAAAWVISARSKMGTFREIIVPRKSLSQLEGHESCPRIRKTHCGSSRFPLLASPNKDLMGGTISYPWRACGSAV